MFLIKGNSYNLFFVVSTNAYLVITTSNGFNIVVESTVENIVLNKLKIVEVFPK
jgi:hypothetical protein